MSFASRTKRASETDAGTGGRGNSILVVGAFKQNGFLDHSLITLTLKKCMRMKKPTALRTETVLGMISGTGAYFMLLKLKKYLG